MILSLQVVSKFLSSDSDIEGCAELALATDQEVIADIESLLLLLKNPLAPVFESVSKRLALLGEPIVQPVREILLGDDSYWKYAVIYGLLSQSNNDVIQTLYQELENIAKMPTPMEEEEEVDLLAQKLLQQVVSGIC